MICKKVYGRILHALILKYLIAIYVVRCNRIYSLLKKKKKIDRIHSMVKISFLIFKRSIKYIFKFV